MSEPTGGKPNTGSETQTGGEQQGESTGGKPQFTPEQQTYIDAEKAKATKKANDEAAASRLELKAMKDKQKADEDAKLAADKKFEELATQREKEINDLKAQVADKDAMKAQIDAIQAERKAELLARLPTEKREAFKDFSNEQLKIVVDNIPSQTQPHGQSQGSEQQQGGAEKAAKDYTESELLALRTTNPVKYAKILKELYT